MLLDDTLRDAMLRDADAMPRALLRAAWIVCAAVVIALCAPASALAHPPYEHLERVIVDDRGRQLRLVLSYVDGIGLSDPLKLVVRDSDGRTIAETERGRTISVICVRSRACVVFVYDMISPLPSHTLRLHDNGRLEETQSVMLAVLGVIAPLWSDAWGYVVTIGFLLLPWPVCVVLSRVDDNIARAAASEPTRSIEVVTRQLAIAVGFIGIAFYYFVCAGIIGLLAELSPLLAIGSALSVWGTIAFSLRGSQQRAVAAA
jgi:hypothetical protein